MAHVDARRQRPQVAHAELVLRAGAHLGLRRVGSDHVGGDASARIADRGVVEVQVAGGGIDLQAADRVNLRLRLEAVHVRGTDVGGQSARCRRRARQRAHAQGQLDVLVVVVEGGQVQAHAPLEQVGLQAELVGGQGLRLERQRLRRIEGPRIDAAALVARRGLHIGHDVVGQLIVESQTIVGASAAERGRLAVQVVDEAVVARGRNVGAVGVVPIVGVRLLLTGVTHTGIDGEGLRRMPLGIQEARAGRRVHAVGPVDEVKSDPR